METFPVKSSKIMRKLLLIFICLVSFPFAMRCMGDTSILPSIWHRLDSLKFSNNYYFKQKAVLHEGFASDSMTNNINVCEFAINDTLYIISEAFDQDYNEFKHDIPDVPTLVSELLSIYPTEGDCDNCGYILVVDSHTPASLTIYTDLDTIQYTTIPHPDLYMASIGDALYGSSNVRCGAQINKLFDKLLRCRLCHDYMNYSNIVLIPQVFDYLSYQQKGYLTLPDACLLLKIKNNLIERIELRQFNYSGKKMIDALLFY